MATTTKDSPEGFHERYERNVPPHIRQKVFERDNWQCQSCGTIHNLEQHHIVYRSRGGTHRQNNLVTLCVKCHRRIHLHQLDILAIERADFKLSFFFTRRYYGPHRRTQPQ